MARPYVARPEHGSAWVTGASSGIGRALALELARRGWRVGVTARSAEALTALAQAHPGSIVPLPGDVTDADAMARIHAALSEQAGAPVLVYLNAGIYLPTRAHPFDREAYAASVAVNLMGTVNGLAAAIPPMVAAGRGQIWLTSSVAGYGPLPTSAAYGATKAGLINLAGSLKFDLDLHGVHIGVINPGFVDTPATRRNPFEMPFLMAPDAAAHRIAEAIARPRFEVAFPRRFALMLRAIAMLPYDWGLALIARATRWHEVGRQPPGG